MHQRVQRLRECFDCHRASLTLTVLCIPMQVGASRNASFEFSNLAFAWKGDQLALQHRCNHDLRIRM